MARIFPFRPYRYADAAGRLGDLVTQPYDKIDEAMRERYLAASPRNIARVILGRPEPGDGAAKNVYTRAAEHFNKWIGEGVLVQDREPALYAYFQEFTPPDSSERVTRKGFIGLGAVEPYADGVVHRHEHTLAGPKKDRMQVLEATRAHFGQIFMLYSDPEREIDALLDTAAAGSPVGEVTDEYGVVHRLWRIADAATIERVQSLMSARKLLIADGHHRYETALAFRERHPELEDAGRVMMTFVNMDAPGLRILATHRLVSDLPAFDLTAFLERAEEHFFVEGLGKIEELLARQHGESVVIGIAAGDDLYALTYKQTGRLLDVKVLHDVVLGELLGISEMAIRDGCHLTYVRGLDKAVAAAVRGDCQLAFLLRPTPIEQVARVSFGGGVMPQKSTDFYPKLLTGLTIYRIEK